MIRLTFAIGFLLLSVASHAGCLDGNNYLSKPNGDLIQLSFYESSKACPTGKHSPTARELAVISKMNGAKGIMEISVAQSLGANPDEHPFVGANLKFYQQTGYELIDTLIPGTQGIRDRFYFNPSGYKQPESIGCGGYGSAWSWSASIYTYLPEAVGYQFEGESGDLVIWSTDTTNGENRRLVMCLPD